MHFLENCMSECHFLEMTIFSHIKVELWRELGFFREVVCIGMNILYYRFSHHSHFQSIDEKEDDVESGRGASLPQSPHSVEGAIGGPSSTLLPSEVSWP